VRYPAHGDAAAVAEPLTVPEIVSFPVELDVRNSELFEAALLGAFRPGVSVVIVDMGRTEFCDCSGVRCLLAAHEHAAAMGAELRVACGSHEVRRLLQLVCPDVGLLPIYPDMIAALSGEVSGGYSQDARERCTTALKAARDLVEIVAASVATSHQLRAQSAAMRYERSHRRQAGASLEVLRKSEVGRLYLRVESMPIIEQAKGILMHSEHCTADEAFDLLRRASQRSNLPVRRIAADIVERTATGTNR
jgi:anti-anti-sigma factor